MIRRLNAFLIATVALALVLSMAQGATLTRHVRDVTLNGQAQMIGHLPATQTMRIVLVLPLRNQDALNSLINDLYDPASPSYRHFLSVDEFTAQFGPTQADYDALTNFAQNHGLQIAATSRNRMNLDVIGTVAKIESALHVTMGLYQHPNEKRTFFAPDREPTPDLSIPLWHIAGLDNYDIPQPLLSKNPNAVSQATTGSCPSASFCGSDMRAAYYGSGSLTGSGQTVGLLEYVGTDLADLATYYTNAHQTLTVPISLVSTDGSSTSCLASAGCDDTEQTLDMTQALGMAPGLSKLVMYVGGTDVALLNGMATASPLDYNLSSSWTWRPADPATDDPYFQEFVAQGQTYFQAAGDSGKWNRLQYVYPADDDYTVSVGGTDLTTASAAGPWASETAWSSSGGGISPAKIAIPSWQVTTAAGCASCSQTYRNGPDVAANANYTFYVCANQTTCTANNYGGTSFAAPMWAGYLALANQQNMALHGTPLGFINPTLYTIGLGSSYTTNFHDITSGSNGFSATTGYDLVTGWGSPNGDALINTLTGGSGSGDFAISVKPLAVSVARGAAGHTKVTTTISGSFNAAVGLTASGQGSGVTVTFTPTSIAAPGAGSSVVTIKVAAGATTGTRIITVTGTSGSTTHTAKFKLTIS
ncbi:MAG TPA: S53 family serine peptidase [Bryobacteraceae bacterium]|nr:S53 family serine peptidase [Bryobacteraceae bacterium]